jgi:hypothetical protein
LLIFALLVSFNFFIPMKKLLWLIPVSIVLYACPYESTVPMSSHPAESIDSNLIGYWYGIIKDGSDFFGIEALDIAKESDSTYSIIRYGKAVKGDIILPDTAHFTGYTSYIGDQRFMNIEGSVVIVDSYDKKHNPKVTTQKVFYVSAIDRSNDTLSVRTITETFTTQKYFGRPDDFRHLVTDFLSKGKNIYDDQYSLKYHKISRPAHY